MGFLTEKEIAELMPSELLPHATPIPTQIVSSDEYTPPPQSEKQKQVEARLLDLGDELGRRQGLSRRDFSRPPRAWRRASSPSTRRSVRSST
jgi:uncharacterized protein